MYGCICEVDILSKSMRKSSEILSLVTGSWLRDSYWELANQNRGLEEIGAKNVLFQKEAELIACIKNHYKINIQL